MDIKNATSQELVDHGTKTVIELYHMAKALHSRACAINCKKSVKATGKLLRNVSKLKDDALDLDGTLDEGNGTISAKSGGT